MTDLLTRATSLLEKVGLTTDPYLEWLRNNPSRDLPYHGLEHGVEVAENAQYLANELGLSAKATKHLTVAALLHDYGHTGDSKKPDGENIAIAVKFLKDQKELLEADELELKLLVMYVKDTQHPAKKKPATLNSLVMADADLLLWVRENSTPELMLTRMSQLAAETGHEITVASTKQFVTSTRFYTTVAWNLQRDSIWKKSDEEITSWFYPTQQEG